MLDLHQEQARDIISATIFTHPPNHANHEIAISTPDLARRLLSASRKFAEKYSQCAVRGNADVIITHFVSHCYSDSYSNYAASN